MSTTWRNSLLLALVVGSLVGPAAAAAGPIYEPGDVPKAPSQTQANVNANRPAASYYTAQALRAMGARGQAQAEFYATPDANRPAASYYTPQALRAMGARGQAQAELYGSQSVNSPSGTSTEATGDRWGADAYAKSPSAIYHAGQILQATGDRWAGRGAFNKSASVASHSTGHAATSQSARPGNNDSNVLGYILGSMVILLAGAAVLLGMSRRFHTDAKQRIAVP